MAELEKSKQQPVLVYCRSGSRSGHACQMLTKAGFEDVSNLSGGVLAWDNNATVVMYATRFCPYCMRARRLLKNKNIQFEEISVSGNNELWHEMEQRSGQTTVPQIFINDESIGGYDDMALLDRNGELDGLLGL
ncbi:Glutaredoxin [Nymphon striatum]|nr:Glutaredoxin [Nymphon striatum]